MHFATVKMYLDKKVSSVFTMMLSVVYSVTLVDELKGMRSVNYI